MTDTTVEFETLGDTHDNRLNFTLSRIVWEAMEAVGAPCFTEEETAYARQIAQHAGVPGFTGDFDTRIVSADRTIKIDNGSTDLADVSQVVPTINMFAACFAANTPHAHLGGNGPGLPSVGPSGHAVRGGVPGTGRGAAGVAPRKPGRGAGGI